MELALIGIVALLTAGVTLFSGFGLGTILMPVFALFFPVPVPLAIAATAVVHLANNVFKFGLMAKQADWPVAARLCKRGHSRFFDAGGRCHQRARRCLL